jgi:DNA (cytosine-5)-methyltransferase 1
MSGGRRVLELFAGAGGGVLCGELLGHRTVAAVELDAYARRVLLERQNDGSIRPFPIWDDVRTFDGYPWRGSVDMVAGGFPCTDLAACGTHKGIDGPKSGLWFEMLRIVRECEPAQVWIENSPNLRKYLGSVAGELAALGFDSSWGVVGARHAGAPHRRDRLWILATHPHRERIRIDKQREETRRDHLQNGGHPITGNDGAAGNMADAHSGGRQRIGLPQHADQQSTRRDLTDRRGEEGRGQRSIEGWWSAEPFAGLGRVASGVAHRVERLRCLGNGQVPAAGALAWRLLTEQLAAHHNMLIDTQHESARPKP